MALPVAAMGRSAPARDRSGSDELMIQLDALSLALERRLAALSQALPSSAAFARSARADLARHRRERGSRARGEVASGAVEEPRSLARLKSAFEELTRAHANGLPAVRGDHGLVQRLAEHMVDLSRLTTVVDLWIEQESGDE